LHCAEAGGLGRLLLSPLSWANDRLLAASVSASVREVMVKRFMKNISLKVFTAWKFRQHVVLH
jgi:hypothetical protein